MKKISVLVVLLFIASFAYGAPTIDGDMSDAEYVQIATGNGLGTWGMNIDKIVYYPDVVANVLYIGLVGNLCTGSSNAFGLWLGFNQLTGMPAGTSLGGTASAGSYMGDTGNNDYKADFEVDYMFAWNTGGGATNVYFDALVFNAGVGFPSYIGTCDQVGTSATGPSPAGIFSENSVAFAVNNDNTGDHGVEFAIPFAELGVTSSGTLAAFGMVVSNTGWFCQDCAPGTPPSGDLGNNPDYSTLSGGPYHSSYYTLPVELSAFTAVYVNEFVTVSWQTATETDVIGYNIFRSEEDDFSTVQKVNTSIIPGHGTTTTPHTYEFTDLSADPYYTTYYYWLEVVNFGGTNDLYGSIEFTPIDVDQNGEMNIINSNLLPSFPNPARMGQSVTFNFCLGGMEGTVRPVQLNIYNVLGQRVAEVVNDDRVVNNYTVEWNTENFGRGIYFYQLKTEDYQETKKLMID